MEKKVQKSKVIRKAPSLKSIFALDTNTDDYVVLKVKPGNGMDLIRCGFRGTEKVVRVSKADYRDFITVTFFHKNEDVVYAFEPISATSSPTPLSLARNAIIDYIENELKIRCRLLTA